jgi:hypothetical protein
MKNPPAKRPFRIVDLMVLVAATAVAFAIFRQGIRPGMAFTTFGGDWEARLFAWMHQLTIFPAMWSFAVFAIDRFDSRKRRRRETRHAGVVTCYAVTVALAVSSLVSTLFYLVHVLEDIEAIPKFLSHASRMHPPPPFGEAPLEEIVGAAVLGAWSALATSRRWRTDPTWIDRLGRTLGLIWIGMLILYLYGYTG